MIVIISKVNIVVSSANFNQPVVNLQDFLILDDTKRLDPDWARNRGKNSWYSNYNKSINFRTSNSICKLSHTQHQWLLSNKDNLNVYTCADILNSHKLRYWVEYTGCKFSYTRGLSKTKKFLISDFEYTYNDYTTLDSSLNNEMDAFHKQETRNKLLSELF